jgi:hypothetical protein
MIYSRILSARGSRVLMTMAMAITSCSQQQQSRNRSRHRTHTAATHTITWRWEISASRPFRRAAALQADGRAGLTTRPEPARCASHSRDGHVTEALGIGQEGPIHCADTRCVEHRGPGPVRAAARSACVRWWGQRDLRTVHLELTQPGCMWPAAGSWTRTIGHGTRRASARALLWYRLRRLRL